MSSDSRLWAVAVGEVKRKLDSTDCFNVTAKTDSQRSKKKALIFSRDTEIR